MKKILLLVLLLPLSHIVTAQKINRMIKGDVVDSTTGNPLADVTVAFYKAADTSLVNFAFTTPNGNYESRLHLKDRLMVIVSLLGYKDNIFYLDAMPNDWGWDVDLHVRLKQQPYELKETTISAGFIRMKGDTIEINANKIKVLPNSDVSQLFRKIPGFEVDMKGNIKINGSSVSKITVDGSDFFGNNPGLVSKNLRADMIDKVQVYDDKDENNIVSADNSKSINLKLKPGKKSGAFGDALLGYGTGKHYEAGLRINSFKNDRKWSLIANSNNINDRGFDFGFNNWIGNAMGDIQRNGSLSRYFFMFDPNSLNNINGNLNQKSNLAYSFFNEFKRKRKLSVTVNLDNNNYSTLNKSTTQIPVNEGVSRTLASNDVITGRGQAIKLNAKYSKDMDSIGNYTFAANYNSYNNSNQSTSIKDAYINEYLTSFGQNIISKKTVEPNLGLQFSYYLRSRHTKKMFIRFNVKSNFNDNHFGGYQYADDTNNRLNFKNTGKLQSSEQLVTLLWNIPLYHKLKWGFSADAYSLRNNNTQVALTAYDLGLYDFNQTYTNVINALSIRYFNRAQQLSVKNFLAIGDKFYDFSAGVSYLNIALQNQLQNGQQEIFKTYNPWLPFITYNSWKPSRGFYSLRLEDVIEFPTFNQLLPIKNVSNPWVRDLGNPNLAPFERYSFSGNMFKSNFLIFKQMYSNFSINQSDKYVGYITRVNSTGITDRLPVNLIGYFAHNVGLGGAIKLSDKLDLRPNINENYAKTPEIIQGNRNYTRAGKISFTPEFKYDISEILEVEASYTPGYSWYKNNLNKQLNYKQYIQTFSTEWRAHLKKGTELSIEADVNDRRNIPNLGKVVSLVNIYVQQPLDKKEHFNLKLSCYDLLNQNLTLSRTVSGSAITISESNLLNRFFMATLVYKIKNADPQQGGGRGPGGMGRGMRMMMF